MSSELLLQTLQHLSQAVKIVDGDNRTNKLLSCYYLSKIRSLATTGNVSIETPSSHSCVKCSAPFQDSKNFTLSIKPRKIHKGKYKKLVTNSDFKGQNDNKFKAKLGQKYRRLVYNVAESTCTLCNSKTKSSIRFDTKDKSKTKSVDPPIVQLSALELVNPKKRKRAKNAGLILKDSVSSSTSFISSKPKVVQPIKVPPATSKSNKGKKSKNSMAAEKKAKNITAAQKQRKGILLLANVLKMNEQKPQSSSQSMLSKMFK